MTITREFTKEQLQQIIETDHVQCGDASALARIALASLEAEAVHQVFDESGGWFDVDSGDVTGEIEDRNIVRVLFTAPPAPIVPDEIQKLKDGREFKYVKDGVHYSVNYANGWNACRAAMQSKADGTLTNEGTIPGGDSPVIPDGWVACSERMPEDRESVLLWDIDLDDACSGHYSHQTGNFYQAGMIIDNEITHWMPLPAAPQQEAE